VTESTVKYEIADRSIALITLNRPEVMNAQSRELLYELDELWSRAERDEDVRVIVLAAEGDHFSTGHDFRDEPAQRRAQSPQGARFDKSYEFERQVYFGFLRRWRDIPKPSIAAVQGACVAAGVSLVWPCDLIVAADDAWFSDPVVRLGINGVEYHAHTWEFGARKAKEMLFTAGRIDAKQAEKLGMVNHVVPRSELLSATLDLARDIAAMPPFGLAQAKRSVNQTLDIMGQHAALQAAFDIHFTTHGNSLSPAAEGIEGADEMRDMKNTKQRAV
jgi:enoyl-CoA hydratase/carnithine racemase